MPRKYLILPILLSFFLLIALSYKHVTTVRSAATHVVISEVQIAGTNTNDDFIELYNPTDSNFDLNGHRLVKRSSSGTSDTSIKAWDSETIIPPHGFYLWANSGWTPPVTPDTVTAATLAADNGIALRQGAEDSGTIIDGVALGSATNAFVETSPFPTNPTANQSIERKPGESNSTGGNGEDTDNNANDFAIRATSEPQNTGSTAETPSEPSASPTEEVTPTEEISPTETLTPTEEVTLAPTEEPTPTPTEEATPTPTEEVTPTEEPTPTLEPTPTPTPEPTPESFVIGVFRFPGKTSVCTLQFLPLKIGFLRIRIPRIFCS
ncbi:hypothetical protein A2865_04170 [Candidatus Woesebacteria bacterium RIFCSPHIGHO2_01_FULL_39_17]|uniref:LTD domain-containing protein n=1 Tax=Candidatus Woesebacteria bacterium RIFCSPLOWO2_01_FULL_39_14 TaxID=1802518 RepID=A0A1F8BJV7_9BACT|nr:MAG: hypothetical protein A2865_04170 [Candidatus Woesebacteria bacterium RIFCSPHIGHO2_01_FULL_39_17]OGM63578.1 MAG: hypothetical protein A3A52_01160 [Candidatus Woesebacteria bacterium RIFCSPLOWO2_01_FULL_39_14]